MAAPRPPLLPTEAARLLLLDLAPPCCCWTGPLLRDLDRPLVTPPPALPPRPRAPPRPAPRPPRPPRPRPPLFVFMISSRLMSILSAILIGAQYLKERIKWSQLFSVSAFCGSLFITGYFRFTTLIPQFPLTKWRRCVVPSSLSLTTRVRIGSGWTRHRVP